MDGPQDSHLGSQTSTEECPWAYGCHSMLNHSTLEGGTAQADCRRINKTPGSWVCLTSLKHLLSGNKLTSLRGLQGKPGVLPPFPPHHCRQQRIPLSLPGKSENPCRCRHIMTNCPTAPSCLIHAYLTSTSSKGSQEFTFPRLPHPLHCPTLSDVPTASRALSLGHCSGTASSIQGMGESPGPSVSSLAPSCSLKPAWASAPSEKHSHVS